MRIRVAPGLELGSMTSFRMLPDWRRSSPLISLYRALAALTDSETGKFWVSETGGPESIVIRLSFWLLRRLIRRKVNRGSWVSPVLERESAEKQALKSGARAH